MRIHMACYLIPQMRHVVFIGESGAGKSSVINLFADRECVATSSDATPCTRDFIPVDVSIDGITYRLWDTPGLTEASGWISRSSNVGPLERFLQERYRSGELDILVFCVRGSRASEALPRPYKTFGRTSRQFAIPVVLVITHLERKQPTMDAWWQDNERNLANLGLAFDGHACLTCLPAHHRRWASQQDIRFLISAVHRRGSTSLDSSAEYLSARKISWNV